jgi:FkbM family methyltransferase
MPKKRQRRTLKALVKDYLRRGGFMSAGEWSKSIMAAVRLVDADLARFEWLYDNLADDESRDVLVKVLAFRALGHRAVRLPLNTPAYWSELKQMEPLADPTDFIQVRRPDWRLRRMDLSPVGVPVQVYATNAGAHKLFVLEQYRSRSNFVDVAVEPGDYVIDAGACWGDTALYLAHRARPDGMVYGMEFVPDNLEILRRNLALNPDLSSRIRIIERAAWNESNVAVSVLGEGPGSSVSVGETGSPDSELLTLAIDDLVRQEDLARVDFIKMDIEGAELSALGGATQTIQHHRPILAISVYHRLSDFFEIPEFLDSLGCGYRYWLRHFTIHAEETILFAHTGPW